MWDEITSCKKRKHLFYTNLQVQKQSNVHNRTVHHRHVDQVQPLQHQTARLQHLVQQVVRLVPFQHQIHQFERLQIRQVRHQPLEGRQQLTAGPEQLDRFRILTRSHIAREDVVERFDP